MPARRFDPRNEWLGIESTGSRGVALALALLFVVPALLFALGQCTSEPTGSETPAPRSREASALAAAHPQSLDG